MHISFLQSVPSERQSGIGKLFWTGGRNLYVGFIPVHIPVSEKLSSSTWAAVLIARGPNWNTI